MNAVRRFFADVMLRDWGTKTAAFLLAVILFVLTRNEVSRNFQVPLRVEPDPDRVLVTRLPEAVAVEIRGPWTRVNRLQALDLGQVVLPLAQLRPGPLRIDPASVVMPPGVVLDRIVYDPVDLRFEPVIEREVAVAPVLSGRPDPDYEVSRVSAEPVKWRIRGGRSVVQAVRELPTEAVDIAGATADVVTEVQLMDPPADVSLRAAGFDVAEPSRVTVRVEISSPVDVRTVEAPVSASASLNPPAAFAPVKISIRGPRRALRRLDALGLAHPVRVEARAVEGEPGQVELHASFDPDVPDELVGALSVDPLTRRVARPAPSGP